MTVPVGAGVGGDAGVTVAWSEMGLPMVTDGVAVVEIEAVAWLTIDVSLAAPQGLVTAA